MRLSPHLSADYLAATTKSVLIALFALAALAGASAHGQGCPPWYTQNFDGVTPPVLPAGWMASQGVNVTGAPIWGTSTVTPDTPPNDVFSTAPDNILDNRLDLMLRVGTYDNTVSFRHAYNLEDGFDGAVLEVSIPYINGGAFTDITDPAVGGSFFFGGYNRTISTAFQSPIAGRMAWSGDSRGYITTLAFLGARIVNTTFVTLRFRLATDNRVASTGWRIDTFVWNHNECPPPTAISGTISYCSNPVPGPVPNVMLTLTGTTSGSTLTDVFGNYSFTGLASGGNYTVMPAKAARVPGSANISTVDVIATQRHFLNLGPPLSGCRLTAADVNGDSAVNTVDVVAIQRFFLGLSTEIANVGKYQFTPTSRSYSGIVSNQTSQNYNALVFGDVTAPFVEP